MTAPPPLRAVEVAIDAAGAAGERTFTYGLPERLDDLVPGEAVIVEFGRRQALGIVLGPAEPPDGVAIKPVLERVRADGPLLPPLSIELARWISATYLAPPALVIRAMLPPGLLERLELVAELLPDPAGGTATGVGVATGRADGHLLDQLAAGPRPLRELVAPEGRAALVRRARALAAGGRIGLEWTLTVAGGGPRYERWLEATAAGREAARGIAA
ncbi:MAG: hypothetical protein RL338_525, partial [Chloroflexota bacterium]